MKSPPPYFSRAKPLCRLSDPAQPHWLCRRRRPSHPPLSICFSCKGKHLKRSKYYYYCATCNLEFHRGCHIFLPEIRSAFHPSHPLTFTILLPKFNVTMIPKNWSDSSSASRESEDDGGDDDEESEDDGDDDEDDGGDDDEDDGDGGATLSDGNHLKCKCCGVPLEKAYYHCSICKFNLNTSCSMTPPPPIISYLKSHEHTLTLFPIRLPLPCDACGLSLNDTEDLVYSCLPCSRMVHRSCIYLPRVIKITRHPHRLSLTSSLQPGDFSCGVCRKTVDVNYGQYSCNKGCHYAVHSKCATREDVWDGKDLDGVPEEPDEYIEPPFLKIDEETIQYFSHHEHYMKLLEKKTIGEKDKFCEACTLPVMISQRYYACMQCDFILDEACASLPRKIYNPLHKHPLTLHPFHTADTSMDPNMPITKTLFSCLGCRRYGCGFLYRCHEKDCEFQLDVKCASLPDPLIHGCHPHDLFFNLTRGKCMGCGTYCSNYSLECIECKTFLGIRCATFPTEAHYKHDRHPLTLCYGEEDTTSGQYWCEKCESKLDPRTWFYTCDSCRITLHVTCLLGEDIYMKPNFTFVLAVGHDDQLEIARNDGNSRLLCSNCNFRCTQTLVFKRRGEYESFCTLICLGKSLDSYGKSEPRRPENRDTTSESKSA
ncbi:DC1 [Arabidopsis thaliana x Arabidopsis arenosa]|uniref:DC1 n=1 Tax=Arabidopsis thaliana x Arabidopsis arenosa TaxID=1240361 RepID=A0A8T2CAG5_9BRAS|nr:DC1 [Arabidopsis thaliana x Arabidopsis arenosa]